MIKGYHVPSLISIMKEDCTAPAFYMIKTNLGAHDHFRIKVIGMSMCKRVIECNMIQHLGIAKISELGIEILEVSKKN